MEDDPAPGPMNDVSTFVLSKLEDLCLLPKQVKDETQLLAIVQSGLTSDVFRKLIMAVLTEVALLSGMPALDALDPPSCAIHMATDAGSEYLAHDPHQCLESAADRMYLLDYFTSELQLQRMMAAPDSFAAASEQAEIGTGEAERDHSSRLALACAHLLSDVANVLEVPVAGGVVPTLNSIVARIPDLDLPVSPPLVMAADLSATKLRKVEALNAILAKDYTSRKRMLLTRLDVTLTTLLWSKKTESSANDQLVQAIQRKRQDLVASTHVTLYDLFCASAAMLMIHKTSDAIELRRAPSVVRKYVMDVDMPDRGGRFAEGRTAHLMPGFRHRVTGGKRPRGRGRGNIPSYHGKRNNGKGKGKHRPELAQEKQGEAPGAAAGSDSGANTATVSVRGGGGRRNRGGGNRRGRGGGGGGEGGGDGKQLQGDDGNGGKGGNGGGGGGGGQRGRRGKKRGRRGGKGGRRGGAQHQRDDD